MAPVLCVDSPATACSYLENQFGFRRLGSCLMAFGNAQVAVVSVADEPDDLIAMHLDQVAFSLADAEATSHRLQHASAVLDPRFTPDGPSDIPDFRDRGVRFVFRAGANRSPF